MGQASQPSVPLLTAVALRRQAADQTVLLDDISLGVAAGQRIALAGDSGSGKSLLLRALVLLDPISDGRVEFRGQRPSGEALPGYRRQVVYLAQDPAFVEGTVQDQIALPWSFATADGEVDHDAALQLFARAGRDASFMAQRSENLSGGEAQLVALVRALLLAPTILLLDEPTAAMDRTTRDAAEDLLAEWRAEDPQRAWVWVSHDPEQLARTCDRQLTINQGRLVA